MSSKTRQMSDLFGNGVVRPKNRSIGFWTIDDREQAIVCIDLLTEGMMIWDFYGIGLASPTTLTIKTDSEIKNLPKSTHFQLELYMDKKETKSNSRKAYSRPTF